MRRPLASLLFVLVVSTPAFADIITITPSAYPLGTDLNAMVFPGVTIDRITQAGGSTVYTPTVTSAFTGPTQTPALLSTAAFDNWFLCSHATAGSLQCLTGYNVLEMVFETPTNYVALIGNYNTDAPRMVAYNSLGEQVAYFGGTNPSSEFTATQSASSGPGAFSMDLGLTRAQGDIARIVYGGDNVVLPRQIRYNQETTQRVAEPTTLGFMALGLLGAVLVKKRER